MAPKSRSTQSSKTKCNNIAIKPQDKVDIHGVQRAACGQCAECPQFISVPGHVLCAYCGCPPVKHDKVDRKRGRESESGDSPELGYDSGDRMSEDSDEDSADTSSGVSSYSGGGRSRHGSRRQPRQEEWSWRPSAQVSAPPPRVSRLLDTPPADSDTQLEHSWSEVDSSPNIYIKADDRLTFHRNPVYQTTDAVRGKGGAEGGYTAGLHVWRLTWPAESRGTHPVVGVATRDCHLTEPGYRRLVGSSTTSWGWCLKSLKVYHDSRKYRNGVPYPRDIDEKLKVPNSFYMILDMDRGTLAFQIDNDFLGVAFSGLRGEELFPIVSAVWGHCEVTLTYIGNHFFDGDRSDA